MSPGVYKPNDPAVRPEGSNDSAVEIGETVRFGFAMHPPIQGVLVSKPQATGDCWIVRQDTGTPVYIQQFDYMHPIRSDGNEPF